ncbi:MAG: GPR endopeptidase [Clostridia bacterium]|nr:GPR endopeptidase [Clostridia bacterium]
MYFQRPMDTDLACERHRSDLEGGGAVLFREQVGALTVERLLITTPSAGAKIGKGMGTYITLSFPPQFECDGETPLPWETMLGSCLCSLWPPPSGRPVLAVGLGNPRLTADSLGPRVMEGVVARGGASPLCTFCPGVSAESGIESARATAAVAREIGAGAVIAVDALCARSPSRLLSTVQLSSGGITPGSGTSYGYSPLSEEALGIPVVSIGVPTVIGVHSCIEELAREVGSPPPDALLEEAQDRPLFVCPIDADLGIARAAHLISRAMNSLP